MQSFYTPCPEHVSHTFVLHNISFRAHSNQIFAIELVVSDIKCDYRQTDTNPKMKARKHLNEVGERNKEMLTSKRCSTTSSCEECVKSRPLALRMWSPTLTLPESFAGDAGMSRSIRAPACAPAVHSVKPRPSASSFSRITVFRSPLCVACITSTSVARVRNVHWIGLFVLAYFSTALGARFANMHHHTPECGNKHTGCGKRYELQQTCLSSCACTVRDVSRPAYVNTTY